LESRSTLDGVRLKVKWANKHVVNLQTARRQNRETRVASCTSRQLCGQLKAERTGARFFGVIITATHDARSRHTAGLLWNHGAARHGHSSNQLDMNGKAADNGNTPGLIRGLGLWASLAVVIGATIGQSVFLVTSDVAREVGSTAAVLAVWLIGGVVALLGTLCYAELGASMPEAGGDYLYLSRGLSPIWGFLYGWTSATVMKPGSAAIISAGLLRFVGFLLPSVAAPIFAWHIWIPHQSEPYQFTFTAAQPLAAAVIVVATVLNYLGVKTVGRFQIFLTALKVAMVAAIVILGLAVGRASGVHPALVTATGHTLLGIVLSALVPVMSAYNGFSNLGQVGGEIVNPQKTFSRAAIFGILSVIGLYILLNSTYFRILGFSRVAQSQHVASDALARLVGDGGARWLTVFMIVSAFGTLHSFFLTGPRVPYAMAQDGNFFDFAKRVQPTFRTPSGAVTFQGCVAILLVLTGAYQELYSFAVFAYCIFYPLTAVALIRLRVKQAELRRPYRVWGYPWTPIVFGAAAFAISVNLWLVRPVRSSIGLAIILLGVPFFYRWRRRAMAPVLVESTTSTMT
jgi:APA family basic amino acid/polyamine antiporter